MEAAAVTATENNFVSGVDTGTHTDATKTSMLTHITNPTEPAETVTGKLDKIADDTDID
jgi:hydroxyethylthiazole kinase-like sugar kinase family protein